MSQALDNQARSGDPLARTPDGVHRDNQGPKKGSAAVPHLMPGKGTTARNRGTMLHGSHERASVSARRASPQSGRASERSQGDPIAEAERCILGALITGALGLRDVSDVGTWFVYRLHAEIFCVLVALLEIAAERGERRRGIDLAAACRACEVCGVWPIRAVATPSGRLVGMLPSIARSNPRRSEALAAIGFLREQAMLRADIERDREVLSAEILEMLEQKSTAFVAGVRYYGSIPLRRGGERAIEREALPRRNDRAALLSWVSSLLSAEAARAKLSGPLDF